MIAFMQMSYQWYCRDFDPNSRHDRSWLDEMVCGGTVVILADDIEMFSARMNVAAEDVEKVEM